MKRRLAADIGMVEAWRFYRACLAGVLRRLGRDSRWRCSLAVTPDRFARPGDRAQGGGDLGARMARALRHMPGGPVVSIGGAVPDIPSADVFRAHAELARHELRFGAGPAGAGPDTPWRRGRPPHRPP